jgi:homoserine kinase
VDWEVLEVDERGSWVEEVSADAAGRWAKERQAQ